MTLVKCNHCNKEFNNKRDNCLWCGKPIIEELKDIKDKELTEKEKEEKQYQKIQFQVNIEYKKRYESRTRVISAVISFIVIVFLILLIDILQGGGGARLGAIGGCFLILIMYFINKKIYSTMKSSTINSILKRIEKKNLEKQ